MRRWNLRRHQGQRLQPLSPEAVARRARVQCVSIYVVDWGDVMLDIAGYGAGAIMIEPDTGEARRVPPGEWMAIDGR